MWTGARVTDFQTRKQTHRHNIKTHTETIQKEGNIDTVYINKYIFIYVYTCVCMYMCMYMYARVYI